MPLDFVGGTAGMRLAFYGVARIEVRNGDNLAGRAIRGSDPNQESRLRHSFGDNARSRDRRKHLDLQRREHSPPQADAGEAS